MDEPVVHFQVRNGFKKQEVLMETVTHSGGDGGGGGSGGGGVGGGGHARWRCQAARPSGTWKNQKAKSDFRSSKVVRLRANYVPQKQTETISFQYHAAYEETPTNKYSVSKYLFL